MKRMLVLCLGLVLFANLACSNVRYVELKGDPSEAWVGKTVRVTFGEFAEISNKAFIVKIVGVDITKNLVGNEKPQKYFIVDRKYRERFDPKIYFGWFYRENNKGIVKCEEIVDKKDYESALAEQVKVKPRVKREMSEDEQRTLMFDESKYKDNPVVNHYLKLPHEIIPLGIDDTEYRGRGINLKTLTKDFLSFSNGSGTSGEIKIFKLADGGIILGVNLMTCGPCCSTEAINFFKIVDGQFVDITEDVMPGYQPLIYNCCLEFKAGSNVVRLLAEGSYCSSENVYLPMEYLWDGKQFIKRKAGK